MPASNVFKKLDGTGKLPTPPGVVLRLLDVTRHPDVSVAQITEVIGTDPGLTGKIVRFVNSPMAGIGREITSLQQAVSLLGIRTVKMMALSFSMLSHRTASGCAGFDHKQFCLYSFACAVAAKHLAAATKGAVPQEGYIAGLLSQIGRSALASALPTEYGKILKAAGAWQRELPDYERVALGTTYPEVGAHLLRSWGLPESLCAAVEIFRSLENLDTRRPLAEILFIAETIADIICAGERDDATQFPRFLQGAKTYFDLDNEKCARIIRDAAHELDGSRDLFELRHDDMRSVDEIEAEVRERITELGLAMHLENQSLAQRQEELLRRATTDPLTGIGNRAAFDARLNLELERAARDGSTLGLLLGDVDYFKKFNDTYGHQAGDRVLQNVARVLEDNVRKVDYAARYGGEEFVVIVPAISIQGIVHLAERLRAAVEQESIRWEGKELHVTISMGVAVASQIKDVTAAAVQLIRSTDEQLYVAKREGRNRVAMQGHAAHPEPACS